MLRDSHRDGYRLPQGWRDSHRDGYRCRETPIEMDTDVEGLPQGWIQILRDSHRDGYRLPQGWYRC